MSVTGLAVPEATEVQHPIFSRNNLRLAVLRLDQIHPLISGNKWFKLKHYLQKAEKLSHPSIVTFGGAYSNHLHAVAAACRHLGYPSAAVVRGEQPAALSPTLQDVVSMGMDLFFVSRKDYTEKKLPNSLLEKYPEHVLVPEGGYGIEGATGASGILPQPAYDNYSHIIAACGTGTTLAGLALAARPRQQVLGISVLKNHLGLPDNINQLLPANKRDRFQVLHDYHFGGYARHTPLLVGFMNDWYLQTKIPTDFVYTGKMMYAVVDLAEKQFFTPGSHLLAVHSGGLQGNRSLPKGSLIF